MNERIKELAKQAWLGVVSELNGTTETYEPTMYEHMHEQKFAELIIKECMRICKDVEYFDVYDDPEKNGHIRAGAAMCREDIKEHFGVK